MKTKNSVEMNMRKNWLVMFIFAMCVVFSAWAKQVYASDAERLSQLLEEAFVLFQHAEYVESYKKYQEVLELDPDHQNAIEQTLDLAAIFKRSGELWKQQGELEEAQKNTRFYQQIIRTLLKLLTERLQTVLKEYNSHTDTEKMEEKSETIQQLRTLIQILTNIQSLYQHFYQNDDETKTLLDKLQRTVDAYQKALKLYE